MFKIVFFAHIVSSIVYLLAWVGISIFKVVQENRSTASEMIATFRFIFKIEKFVLLPNGALIFVTGIAMVMLNEAVTGVTSMPIWLEQSFTLTFAVIVIWIFTARLERNMIWIAYHNRRKPLQSCRAYRDANNVWSVLVLVNLVCTAKLVWVMFAKQTAY